MTEILAALEDAVRFLRTPLFYMGDSSISVFSLLMAALWLAGVLLFAQIVRRRVLRKLLARTKLDEGAQYAIMRTASYVIVVTGIFIGLPMVGIDMTSLAVLMGALGVGIGFGLQGVAANFVSGLIILFQRPIKIGDRVELGGGAAGSGSIIGDVVDIRSYSSTIRTNDNIEVIVPNSRIISDTMVNWSHHGRVVRIRVPVGVSYDSDVYKVKEALLDVAREDPDVLDSPEPRVILKEFGESAIHFELRVWTTTMLQRPGAFKSQLYFAVWDKFKAAGIKIPYPQRDVHLKGVPPPAPPETKPPA